MYDYSGQFGCMGDSWIVESLAESMEEEGVDPSDLPDQEVEDIMTELIEEMSHDLFDNLNNEEISVPGCLKSDSFTEE